MTEPRISTNSGGCRGTQSPCESPIDPAVVDSLRRLGARSGRNVLGELTALFLSTADGHVEAAERLLGRSELPELARVAHALKGSASVIGGRRLSAAAAALEETCLTVHGTTNTEEAVRAALAHFQYELELLRVAIRELSKPG